jgi:hypothetical protein
MTCGQFGRCGSPPPPPVCVSYCAEPIPCDCHSQVCETFAACCNKVATVCH